VILTGSRVAKLEIAAALYTPETLAALDRYRVHLRDTRARLEERRAVAVEELKRYGDVEGSEKETGRGGYGDSGALAGIASRYGDLVREVENVRMEIARLGE
jgi:diphthamide biosynthesis protein 3